MINVDEINHLVNNAKLIVENFFQIKINVQISFCSQGDLINKLKKELILSNNRIEIENLLRFNQNFVLGHFFKNSNQILIVKDRGISLENIIHLILHSVQNNRSSEDLINYLTFKLTKKYLIIVPRLLKKWETIEKREGIIFIKNMLLNTK